MLRVYDYLNYDRCLEDIVEQHLIAIKHTFISMSRFSLNVRDECYYIVVAKNMYPRDVTKAYSCLLYNSSMDSLLEPIYDLSYVEALSVVVRRSR